MGGPAFAHARPCPRPPKTRIFIVTGGNRRALHCFEYTPSTFLIPLSIYSNNSFRFNFEANSENKFGYILRTVFG